MGYAQEKGIDVVGFDFSDFATKEGLFSKCKQGTLIQHDANKRWPYKTGEFDFTICLDLIEHIYEEDIDFVLNELFRTNSKYIFLQIATTNNLEYSLLKGQEIPEEIKSSTLTGHVHMRHKEWWIKKLDRKGWKINEKLLKDFFDYVGPILTDDCAWKTNLVLVLEYES